jgi:hypothetical protein
VAIMAEAAVDTVVEVTVVAIVVATVVAIMETVAAAEGTKISYVALL